MQTGQWCRIFLSTEGDSSPSKLLKLKNDLVQNAIVIEDLEEKLAKSQSQTDEAEHNCVNLFTACDEYKATLSATTQELTEAKSAYLEEVQKSSVYVEQIMDLTLAKNNYANEVEDLKKGNDTMKRELQSQRDKCTAMAKKNRYEKEYFDLKKSFDDVLAKQNIINSKYIEIAISGTTNPDAVRARIQNLEKQLTESKAKEDKLFADVKRLAKKKSDIYEDRHRIFLENLKINNDKKQLTKENQQLREKLGFTDEVASESQEHTSNHAAKDKDLQEQLMAARENVFKLQKYKQNWVAENRTLQQNLKTSNEKIKTLQGSLYSLAAEKRAIQNTLNEVITKNQILRGTAATGSTAGITGSQRLMAESSISSLSC